MTAGFQVCWVGLREVETVLVGKLSLWIRQWNLMQPALPAASILGTLFLVRK